MTTIYALVDPRNGDVRYVGQSVSVLLNQRRAAHIKGEGTLAKRAWTAELHAAGLEPVLVVLHHVTFGADAAERSWIRHFAAMGAPLFNRQHMPPRVAA